MKKCMIVAVLLLGICGCYQQRQQAYHRTPMPEKYLLETPTDSKPDLPVEQAPPPDPEPTTSLGEYVKIINDSGLGNFISNVSQSGKTATITVRDSWHYEPYQMRL